MKEQLESKKDELMNKAEEATADMSDEAKEVFTKLKSIIENMSLTHLQEREQIKDLFNGTPETVKEELKAAKTAMFGDNMEKSQI